MTLGLQIKGFTDPTMYISTITAFFFLSLGANAVITALIVYKIVTTRNDIREFDPSAQASAYGKKLNLFVSILMESGLISFLGQLTQCIMYASVSFPLVAGGVVILYVRDSSRLLIWCFNFIYLLHREFRRPSLGVSMQSFPTIIKHQGRRKQWVWLVCNPGHSEPWRTWRAGSLLIPNRFPCLFKCKTLLYICIVFTFSFSYLYSAKMFTVPVAQWWVGCESFDKLEQVLQNTLVRPLGLTNRDTRWPTSREQLGY